MTQRQLIATVGLACLAALAVAWLIEQRHILTLREELEQWGRENRERHEQ